MVSSGEGYQSEPTVSGHQTYEFTFDVTIKATVRLNTQAVTPGGVVAVKVTGQQTDTKPSLTAELPDTGFRASATGDGLGGLPGGPAGNRAWQLYHQGHRDGECRSLP